MNTLKRQQDFLDSNFKIKFDGEKHQIDANVLINSLLHISAIIEETNKYFDTDKKIEIKINALDKGSFLIHIELIETAVESLKHLFNAGYVGHVGSIIGTLVGLVQLKQFLKEKKPKSAEKDGNTIKIVNEKGNVFIIKDSTFNIYNNSPIVQDALSQGFETLANDPSISAFEITDKNEKTLTRIDRDEFQSMAIKSDEILNGERVIVEAATLHIVRLSFEGNLKWDFYFKGNKISAKIVDRKFQELIDKGISFAKGDGLEVSLQITQRWDDSANTYVNKSYQVIKIARHIPRNEQGKLDLN
ncbi:MAG: hypothetical protein U0X71_05895 [Sphingobacteriaceae bacterium]|nr:MAG: hypothetical protein E6Q66_10265 [Pedobacter sp.]